MVVRFPLEMKNGVKVREINKFKEHFDIEIVISHFLNGKLLKWLENWNYEEEAKAISVLTKEDPELVKKLCEIFNVEYVIGNIVDVEKIVCRNEKIVKLKQFTDDENIIEEVDVVVFNQEELAKIYHTGTEKIYLCGTQFLINLNRHNITYIGIGKVKIIVDSDLEVDWEKKNISFFNIYFDEKYQHIIDNGVNSRIEKRVIEKQQGNYRKRLLMGATTLHLFGLSTWAGRSVDIYGNCDIGNCILFQALLAFQPEEINRNIVAKQSGIFVKSFFEIRDLGDYPNNEKEFLVYSEQERNRMIKIFSKEFQKKLSVWYKREFTDDFEAKMRTLEKRLKEEVLPNFDASDYDLHNFPYERIEGDRIRLKAIAEVSLEVVVEKCIQATIDFVDNFRR